MSFYWTPAHEVFRRDLEDDAWRAQRFDDLHSDPKALANALFDLDGSAIEPLVDLLAALTKPVKTDTSLDRIVLQHAEAHSVIDRLVQKVVDLEEKRR